MKQVKNFRISCQERWVDIGAYSCHKCQFVLFQPFTSSLKILRREPIPAPKLNCLLILAHKVLKLRLSWNDILFHQAEKIELELSQDKGHMSSTHLQKFPTSASVEKITEVQPTAMLSNLILKS